MPHSTILLKTSAIAKPVTVSYNQAAMKARELREKYLKFFEDKGHKVIPSAPLVPENDPTALFTTAGMHPLVPFLLGLDHPNGKRLTNFQKCLRTDDIEEVGDNWHNTFFEMLGNWSLGSYWKEEAIKWSYEFITEDLKIPAGKLWVSVFEGDKDAPKDEESAAIWKSLGIAQERIIPLPKKDNWWGPVGETGPCGPDTEMFVDTTGKSHGEGCRPGDDCGRFSEIWNDVFMEYERQKDGSYKPLKQRNVDTGMGVERTTAVLQGRDNVYDTDLFNEVISLLKEKSKRFNLHDARIVADHMRAAIFIAGEGIEPSNKDQGYILRRLIRRAEARASYGLGIAGFPFIDIFNLFSKVYKETYPEIFNKEDNIIKTLTYEIHRFHTALESAFKEFDKIKAKYPNEIPGKELFYLHTTLGLTLDIIKDFADSEGVKIDEKGFEEEFTRHQEVSRAGMEKKFTGGLADHSDITVRGHTATHLLHQALRDVLGDHVHQTGSNITPERIRFDFSHSEKMTEEQIKKVEEIVSSKIEEDLIVKREMLSQEEADKKGAIGLFKDKYEDKVSIYEIGDYSVEYCGGPHVEHTSQVGNFKILKEEALGAGQRRIRAVLR